MNRLGSVSVAVLCCALIAGAVGPARAQSPAIGSTLKPSALDQLDSMIDEVEDIMGLRVKRRIDRAEISRGEISALVEQRLDEETSREEISQEELFLRLFGFVDESFDLADQVTEVLTEQATALYDYKTKKLYLATWTPEDMQEYALVHELAHAIADQHFDLDKYVTGGKTADADLARSAVVEGQASWVMTEWVMRKSGRSLIGNRMLAIAASSGSRHEVENYPVYSSSPLYIRETMLFPYADGLVFQQDAVEEYGRAAFTRVFKDPPNSTEQILDADAYFRDLKPVEPKLPEAELTGYERSSRGSIGMLDHRILVQQYLGEQAALRGAAGWRGAHYEIWRGKQGQGDVLRYASSWATAEDAQRFFDDYTRIVEAKWDRFEVHRSGPGLMEGVGDNGRYSIRLAGVSVTSVEGLPLGAP